MALAFVEFCPFERQARWFRESSELGTTYEAKLRQGGRWFSIEFDSLGNLQDLEVEIRLAEMPQPARQRAQEHLRRRFERHRVEKVQAQYVGHEEQVLAWVRRHAESSLRPNFELVARGRDGQGVRAYELLFDNEGALLRESLLVYPNTEHLDH